MIKPEILLFCYPTLLKPGMIAGGIYPPEPCISEINPEQKCTMVVTVASAINSGSSLITQVDILHYGVSVIYETAEEFGYFENPIVKKLPNGTEIYMTSLFVKNVFFKQSGTYEIQVKLVQQDDSMTSETSKIVDTMSSKFMVSLMEDDS